MESSDPIQGRQPIGHDTDRRLLILDLILAVAGGRLTRSEALGHQEFILTYKSFQPLGPACLPTA